MKKVIVDIFVLALVLLPVLLLSGCKTSEPGSTQPPFSPAPQQAQAPAPQDPVLATINGQSVMLSQLEPILIQAYGLNILLDFVQRDLAQQRAAEMNITVTPQDISDERALTLLMLKREAHGLRETGPSTKPDNDDLTPAEAAQLLDQMLTQAHMTRTEFDLIIQINAYLRKIVEPRVQEQMTDDAVRRQFNALYGEKVLVHYIVVKTMNDVADVRRDLAAGRSFEDVARVHSQDTRTAASGGELPPFTLQDNSIPDVFRQTAFFLKKGVVSDPLQLNGLIYIIKLIDRIPPAHAKYEDYREAVRQDLYDKTVQAAMAVMRQQLWKTAQDDMEIRDPELRRQWEGLLARRNGSVRDMQDIRREMDRQHAEPTTQPATQPTTAPAP